LLNTTGVLIFPLLSCCDVLAAADSGTLKAIRSGGAAAGPGVSFGQIQTSMVGEAAALRKKFAAGRT
jgi:hypothetical protein